jgi:hypothetical protein
MGILTPRKVTVRRQIVVPSSSNDDDLPLVKHDAGVDLNPSGMRIRYKQEPTLMSDSPPLSHHATLCRTESASSNQTPRVQRHHFPLKICGLPRTMEFSDDDMEEEQELSNELMASLKQKITTLEEHDAELHQAVYDQQDDFGLLRKATMSKLKRFAKALGDPSLYNAPSP